MAIWKSVDGQRFQNYKAFFTILDINRIAREWLLELQSGTHIVQLFGANRSIADPKCLRENLRSNGRDSRQSGRHFVDWRSRS